MEWTETRHSEDMLCWGLPSTHSSMCTSDHHAQSGHQSFRLVHVRSSKDVFGIPGSWVVGLTCLVMTGIHFGFGILGSGFGAYMYGHDRGRSRKHKLQAGLQQLILVATAGCDHPP